MQLACRFSAGATHFAAAVFDFDDFYKENGVDALSTQGAEQI
ncbi:MAG: hypothetical protein ACOX2O_01265 [Bdellovibrionota bacterium]|jgi:hypothetical protein